MTAQSAPTLALSIAFDHAQRFTAGRHKLLRYRADPRVIAGKG
jgi:hypothetical protein